MKYVGYLNEGVIIAKGKIYEDIVDERHIELTQEQYNTIITPCKLIDGEFVPCDFPKIEEDESGNITSGAILQKGSYEGTYDSTSGDYSHSELFYEHMPDFIFIFDKNTSGSEQIACLVRGIPYGISIVKTSRQVNMMNYPYGGIGEYFHPYSFNWGENSVTFTTSTKNGGRTFNDAGKTYEYIMIGGGEG